jgi:thiamine-monophosphate kinase
MANIQNETIADLGEKRLIAEFIRPFFDGEQSQRLIGDDCAILSIPEGHEVLVSTDRVPADLISFKLGIINYEELGRYLAYLNLSDIAACGGIPRALLLNMGVPGNLKISMFQDICRGVREAALESSCRIVGGDITSSNEISLSATSIGIAPAGKALRRSTARPGNKVFTTRPIGLTPAAFAYHLGLRNRIESPDPYFLKEQFTRIYPLIKGGIALRESGFCTACMDNTDGISQSLTELATESCVSIVVEADRLKLPDMVLQVAKTLAIDPLELALGAGADFSLLGAIDDNSDREVLARHFEYFQEIGRVEHGSGVYVEIGGDTLPLEPKGWNYFVRELQK